MTVVAQINVIHVFKGNLPNTILNVPRSSKSPEELNSERFHLLLGLCVKALCSTRLTYSPETVTSCVNAVNCLLESPWARDCIGNDSVSGWYLCAIRTPVGNDDVALEV